MNVVLEMGGADGAFSPVLTTTQFFNYISSTTANLKTDGSANFIASSSQYLNNTLGSPLSTSAGSFSVWINPTGAQGGGPIPFSIGPDGGSQVTVQFNGASNSCVMAVGGTNPPLGNLTAGSWWHIVGVWSGTNFKAYVNGVQTANQTITALLSGTTLFLGSDTTPTAGHYYNGLIAAPALYNSSLSPTQVTTLYNGGAGYNFANLPSSVGTGAGLYEWWDLFAQAGTNRVGRVASNVLAENNGPITLSAGPSTSAATYQSDPVTSITDQSNFANSLTQATASSRLIYEPGASGINGLAALQAAGSVPSMALSSPISLTGDFCLWAVGSKGSSKYWWACGGSSTSAVIGCYIDGNFYVINDAGTPINVAYNPTGNFAVRVRRSSGTVYLLGTGRSEISMGSLTGTLTIGAMFANTSFPRYSDNTSVFALEHLDNVDVTVTNPNFINQFQTTYITTPYGVSLP